MYRQCAALLSVFLLCSMVFAGKNKDLEGWTGQSIYKKEFNGYQLEGVEAFGQEEWNGNYCLITGVTLDQAFNKLLIKYRQNMLYLELDLDSHFHKYYFNTIAGYFSDKGLQYTSMAENGAVEWTIQKDNDLEWEFKMMSEDNQFSIRVQVNPEHNYIHHPIATLLDCFFHQNWIPREVIAALDPLVEQIGIPFPPGVLQPIAQENDENLNSEEGFEQIFQKIRDSDHDHDENKKVTFEEFMAILGVVETLKKPKDKTSDLLSTFGMANLFLKNWNK